jgi:hypothetical protein
VLLLQQLGRGRIRPRAARVCRTGGVQGSTQVDITPEVNRQSRVAAVRVVLEGAVVVGG